MKPLYFIYLLLALASCKKTDTHLTKITAKTIAINDTIKSSSEVDSIIAPFKEKLSKEMQQVLCYTPKNLVKNDGNMQSTLGNLMVDMCLEVADSIFKKKNNKSIDFAMFNHGGLRATISKGNVTKEQAFQLMPFENELVVVEMNGKKIIELVDYFMKNKRAHPLSKNVELVIDDSNYNLKINGVAFDENKNYTVLTSDYLQNGGSKMIFFKNPEKLIKLDYKVRDAIIDYFKKVDTLQATIDNRVIIKS
ncbi:5'-nucleotidase [Aquimarina sp. 2201CG5-10]|uniref:5'-nucleotidase n=1 Tax=Aquimarina callyspongiae TaxID=3098150 RepID=UPI002AB56658|nr:5'-nucleotidase [Aquimarina sp. 2201CG5-10]MDY8137947.1 5'-nucleotidase [Aquimarina sp. 2201CG5-10]